MRFSDRAVQRESTQCCRDREPPYRVRPHGLEVRHQLDTKRVGGVRTREVAVESDRLCELLARLPDAAAAALKEVTSAQIEIVRVGVRRTADRARHRGSCSAGNASTKSVQNRARDVVLERER